MNVFEAIYEAALEPNLWSGALKEISSALGAVDATIVLQDSPPNLLAATSHAEWIPEYLRDWRDLDIIRRRVSDDVAIGETYFDWKLIPDAVIDRDPFYQEFRRRLGVRHLVGRVDSYSPGKALRFAVQFAERCSRPEADVLAGFDRVANHVRQAFEISARLSPEPAACVDQLGRELATSRFPAAVIDGALRVVFANDRFLALSSRGLDVSGGTIVCANTTDQVSLDGLMRKAVGPMGTGDSRLSLVSGPDGRRRLAVRAMCLSERHRALVEAEGFRGPRAMLLVLSLDEEAPTELGDLLRQLGLTTTESNIAALVGDGMSPKDLASMLNMSEGAVRTRLKGMFAKLRFSRQSEVTRFVARLKMFSAGW